MRVDKDRSTVVVVHTLLNGLLRLHDLRDLLEGDVKDLRVVHQV